MASSLGRFPAVVLVSGAGLVLCGLGLIFPELVPTGSRIPFVGLAGTLALGFGVWLAWTVDRLAGAAAALLGMTAVVSWWTHDRSSVEMLHHFGGLSIGVLSMGVVASACVTERRVLGAAGVFVSGALVILAVGLAAVDINTGKFVGVLREIPAGLTTWLPRAQLPLPGLDPGGMVNPNALGGVVLLVVPTTWAVFRVMPPAGWWAGFRVVAITGVGLGILILLTVRSRTGLAAALVVGLIMGLWRMQGSLWSRAMTALVVAAVAVWGSMYGGEFRLVADSARTRGVIWGAAMERVIDNPLGGIGINQFRSIPGSEAIGVPSTVAHAHNTLLQVALDLGLPGLIAYVTLLARLLAVAVVARGRGGRHNRLAAGAGWSLVAVHVFGIADAITLGAKVGLFVWLNAGLILASLSGQSGTAPGARA
jgi:hypothetical protein